jgi:hypothetical protein
MRRLGDIVPCAKKSDVCLLQLMILICLYTTMLLPPFSMGSELTSKSLHIDECADPVMAGLQRFQPKDRFRKNIEPGD